MRDLFDIILRDYLEATKQRYTNHPIATVIRHNIVNEIYDLIDDKERYIIKGSSGAGNWAKIPWIAIFDILVTKSAQSGLYPVFLFKENMEGFYLSLNQGVTEIKQKYKRDSKQVLNLTSEDYRAQLGNVPENFTLTKINLASQNSKSSEFSVLYEAGNVIAKYYSANALPSEAIFKSDIKEMLKIYEYLSYNENISTSRVQNESDEEAYSGFEELKKFRLHKRIERNSKLSRKAKEYHGYTCKACSMSFDKKYGKLGYQFIEAHHLTPISHLAGARIKLDVRNDFTVLCSNCHSMIHKLVDPSDLNLLIELIKENS